MSYQREALFTSSCPLEGSSSSSLWWRCVPAGLLLKSKTLWKLHSLEENKSGTKHFTISGQNDANSLTQECITFLIQNQPVTEVKCNFTIWLHFNCEILAKEWHAEAFLKVFQWLWSCTGDGHPKIPQPNGIKTVTSLYILQEKVRLSKFRFHYNKVTTWVQ